MEEFCSKTFYCPPNRLTLRYYLQNLLYMKSSKFLRFALQHWFKTLCLLFILYMVFVSEHSVIRIMRLHAQEDELRKEIRQFEDSIVNFQRRIDQVSVDNEALERHARERLHMHRENEDIYIFED